MITYGVKMGVLGGKSWPVYLDDKPVGEIFKVEGGYQYFPKGQKVGGEVFETLPECKKSLES